MMLQRELLLQQRKLLIEQRNRFLSDREYYFFQCVSIILFIVFFKHNIRLLFLDLNYLLNNSQIGNDCNYMYKFVSNVQSHTHICWSEVQLYELRFKRAKPHVGTESKSASVHTLVYKEPCKFSHCKIAFG